MSTTRFMKFENFTLTIPEEGSAILLDNGYVVAVGEDAWSQFFYIVGANNQTVEGEL